MELYESKNTQVFPQTGTNAAINSPLFENGFIDDETPLDQYNLNLLIRAIKENCISIEGTNDEIQNSNDEIDEIKNNYLTITKLRDFLKLTGSKPIEVNQTIKFGDALLNHRIPLHTATNYQGLATIEYIHNVLNNLIVIVDGGNADTAIAERWGGPLEK